MKKLCVFLCVIVVYFNFMMSNIHGQTLKYIDQLVHPGDITVTFFVSGSTKMLYIKSNDKNIGIILEATTTVDVKKEFPVLTSTEIAEYIAINETVKEKLTNENVTILDDVIYSDIGTLKNINGGIILTHESKNMCILRKDEVDLKVCDYIYYVGSGIAVEIPDTVKLVIYDNSVQDEVQLYNYDNYIDTIKLSPYAISTLLWNKDSYQTITLPR